MCFCAGGGLLVREAEKVECVDEGDGGVDAGGFFLETHEDCLAGVVVEEGEECGEYVGEGTSGVGVLVVDLEGVVDDSASDVEVAQTGFKLGP